jgi:hypothetical protein
MEEYLKPPRLQKWDKWDMFLSVLNFRETFPATVEEIVAMGNDRKNKLFMH